MGVERGVERGMGMEGGGRLGTVTLLSKQKVVFPPTFCYTRSSSHPFTAAWAVFLAAGSAAISSGIARLIWEVGGLAAREGGGC